MKGVWLLLLVSVGVGSAFATEYTPREQRSIERGRTSMVELAKALRAKLGEAMDEGGAILAFDVCGSAAQTKQVVIAQRTGVSVGRASLRLRNSASVGPPWVVEWLEAQAEAGESTVEGFERVDNVDGGRVARLVKPIYIEAQCLVCHGPEAGISDAIKAKIAERYPSDQAVNYRMGELRGALWAEAPLAR